MWRCSSSSARRSAVSLPVAHPACTTGPTAPPPTGQSPCNRGGIRSFPSAQAACCRKHPSAADSLCKGGITFHRANRDVDCTHGNPHFQTWVANGRHINKCPDLAVMSTHTYQLSAPTCLPTSLTFSRLKSPGYLQLPGLLMCCLPMASWSSVLEKGVSNTPF